MITLITGLPGNGKTLYAISWIKAKAEKESRPVFYARIRGLKLPWTLIDPFKWADCPANAIIVIDECQQAEDPADPKSPSLFGVRQRGAVVPPWAAALETHRHKGVDLVLITQDPMLLDVHDRKLVGQHFHVIRTFGLARATIHEFTSCRPDVAKSRSNSVRHEWSYPKESFEWYESAEVHTMKARVPARVWILLSLPFIIGALVWWTWAHYLDPNRAKPVPAVEAPGEARRGVIVKGGENGKLTTVEYLAQYQPRVAGLDYTAPVYDESTKPLQAPYPAACVQMGARCDCYSQQGTKLAVPRDLCESIVAGGFFVAWQAPSTPAPVVLNPAPDTSHAVAVSLGGETGGFRKSFDSGK